LTYVTLLLCEKPTGGVTAADFHGYNEASFLSAVATVLKTVGVQITQCRTAAGLNPLTPNDHYSGRTAPHRKPLNVAFYIFIQQIQVLNILNMAYTLRSFFFKMQFVS